MNMLDNSKEKMKERDETNNDETNTNKQKTRKKRIFWITTAIARETDRDREELLNTMLIEFMIYFCFVALMTIYVIGNRNPKVYYLTRGLKQQFTERGFSSVNDAEIMFEDIKTAADFWFFAESHMVNSLFWESTYHIGDFDENAMNILGENRVLGVPRIRQVRVRNDSCVVHEYFRRLFLSCYDSYSAKAENKKPFGLADGTAWEYSSSSVTRSLSYSGKISTYGGGGFYKDLVANKNETSAILMGLKDNLWVTKSTRAIFVDFTVYNANLNLFAICKLVFEFPTTGGVIPTADFRSVKLLRFHTKFDWFILVCELSCYLFVIFYIAHEFRELLYFKLRYFLAFWTWIDFSIIILTLISGLISLIKTMRINDEIEYIKNHPQEYGNLEYMAILKLWFNNIIAVDLFVIYMKIFKFLNFNKTMSQLNNTLKKCASDILGFSVMFFIIFFAYTELGYLIFGSQVESFSSFGIAMFTLLRTILGDFDYHEIEQANRLLAPFYFLSYIFLVFFVLLNMFLAIINDTYADVKTEIAIAPDELQMSGYLRRGFMRFFRKFGCFKYRGMPETKSEINATIRQIRDALKKCGFSDLEIEMFFARYNIDPLAEMNVQNNEKLLSELENILKGDSKENYVKIDDFISQQERLEQIDRTIGSLVEQIKFLLIKLKEMENVNKIRKN
ncbi:unnamed protein product [Phaedon cochleariae]|uniref:Polycystic kidney disease 2-like 1 protein n=1 Tax=Phaedon cochleariae TaxID=80249 RepID=A0A9N9X4S6_PHACE|nr:unnamed protein product [Phaedon cochleariae]